MRCKTCDYALWNIRTRQCPECSAPFRPSDFEFAPMTVKYCCPHCGQHYFGTDVRGHLAPIVFDCVTCKAHVHMDEMVLAPASGTTDEGTQVDRMPWLERGERGPIMAWFATLKWAMVQPNRLIRAVPANGSVGAAWLYAVLTLLLFCSIGVLAPQMFMTLRAGARVGFLASSLGTLAGLVIGCGVLLWIWALSAHGLLRMTGGNVKPLARTCHSIFYSTGAASVS